jgi:hypothetical protein
MDPNVEMGIQPELQNEKNDKKKRKEKKKR